MEALGERRGCGNQPGGIQTHLLHTPRSPDHRGDVDDDVDGDDDDLDGDDDVDDNDYDHLEDREQGAYSW